MTGDGDERAAEVVGHRLHEPRLPAAGRALEQDRQPLAGGRPEDLLLVADRQVERPGRGGHRLSSRSARRSVRRTLRWKRRRWASAAAERGAEQGPDEERRAAPASAPWRAQPIRTHAAAPRCRCRRRCSGTGNRCPGGGPRRALGGRRPRRRRPRSRGRRRSRPTARPACRRGVPPCASSTAVPWRMAAPRRVYAPGTRPSSRRATVPSR